MQGLLWNIYHRSDGMLLDGGWYEDTPEGALEVALGSELFTLEMMDEAWIEEIRSALICGETYTVGGETRTCTLPHHTDTDPLHG